MDPTIQILDNFTMHATCAFLPFYFSVAFALPKSYISYLFVDFDGTVATSEAFETLAEAAYESNTNPDPALPPWRYFSEAYYADYATFADSYPSRTNLTEELTFRSHPERYAVEANSFDRVHSAGVFDNVTFPVLAQYAQKITVRDGFWDMVESGLDRSVITRILSLNWSVGWIRLILREDLKKNGRKASLAEKVAIYCSEIVPRGVIPPVAGKGVQGGVKLDNIVRLHTGGDKVSLMRKIVEHEEKKGRKGQGRSEDIDVVVFIGDSSEDLPPLVEAQVGIIAGEDESTLRRLGRFGVDIVELGKVGDVGRTSNMQRDQESGADIEFLYQLTNFNEVVNAFWGSGR